MPHGRAVAHPQRGVDRPEAPLREHARDAGIAMLRALVAEPQPLTVTVPDDNDGVGGVLAQWGFKPVNAALRMRHGPPVGHDPSKMFGLFNLFFG